MNPTGIRFSLSRFEPFTTTTLSGVQITDFLAWQFGASILGTAR